MLAYQLVQAIRRMLLAQGDHLSWSGLRAILAVQQRVTATFRLRDGRTCMCARRAWPNQTCAISTMLCRSIRRRAA